MSLKSIYTIVTIFVAPVIIPTIGRTVLPEPGFRFLCGTDVCIFPDQYCDSDRCSYCSDDVCHSGNIPEQCRYSCTEVLSTSTPRSSTIIEPKHAPVNNQEYSVHEVFQLVVVALVLSSSAVTYILLREACRCWRSRGLNKQYMLIKRDNKEMPLKEGIGAEIKNDAMDQSTLTDSLIVTHPQETSVLRTDNLGDHRIL